MAGTTVRAKLTLVLISCRMARITIFGRAFVYVVNMTGLALDTYMRPRQCKSRFAVIECHILPAAGVMAACTSRAHLAFMHILRGVTGETVFGGTLVSSVHMTGDADDIRV